MTAGMTRARVAWVAMTVSIAVTLGGGALLPADADIASGDRGVFVPIVPCRLVDTRPTPDTVGLRSDPLKPAETFTQTVRGANGNCTIPDDAVGVAMNVTISVPSASSFLTIWPADAPRPLASNLNWQPLDAPTPNKVDVKLSADGKVSFFNKSGFVDVIADVVGYYANHNHDDRYFTKAQVDAAVAAAVATRVPLPTGARSLIVPGTAFIGLANATAWVRLVDIGSISQSTGTTQCALALLSLPDGVTVTSVVGHLADVSGGLDGEFGLVRDTPGPSSPASMAQGFTSGTPGETTVTDSSVSTPVINNSTAAYSAYVCLSTNINAKDVVINYTY